MMQFLQLPSIDLTGNVFLAYAILLAYAAFLLLIGFILVRIAVRSGTKEQRRLSRITNKLLAEQLRLQGAEESRIAKLMNEK